MGKILLIEDNPVDIQTVRTRLTAKGYEVIVAKTGREGIRIAAKQKPALILMDMILPGMHGLEATIRLKEMPETRDIPIIALTVMDSPDFVNACFREGICAFIRKPYDFKEIFDKVERFVTGQEKKPRKILVIDKDLTVVTMVMLNLMKHGYRVISASDGKTGVRHALKMKPDLILLDPFVPGSKEDFLWSEFKQSTATREIPMILMKDELSVQEKIINDDKPKAEAFIVKPFSAKELIHKIEKVLEGTSVFSAP